VLEGLRGEDGIAELCRKEGIAQNLYYRWSKDFLEAGRKRLAGDTSREATSDEVKELRPASLVVVSSTRGASGVVHLQRTVVGSPSGNVGRGPIQDRNFSFGAAASIPSYSVRRDARQRHS
jgi:hypothetical protein